MKHEAILKLCARGKCIVYWSYDSHYTVARDYLAFTRSPSASHFTISYYCGRHEVGVVVVSLCVCVCATGMFGGCREGEGGCGGNGIPHVQMSIIAPCMDRWMAARIWGGQSVSDANGRVRKIR